MNHEAWVIPYADLLTLLMAMFIALFAISTVDVVEVQGARDRLQRSARRRQARQPVFAGSNAKDDVADPGQRQRQRPGLGRQPRREQQHPHRDAARAAARTRPSKLQNAKAQQAETLEDVQKADRSAPRTRSASAKRHPDRSCNNGLEVTLVTDKVLFDSGQADAAAASGQPLLERRSATRAEAGRQPDRSSTATPTTCRSRPRSIPSNLVPLGAAPTRSPSTSCRSGSTEARLFPAGLGDHAIRSRRTRRPTGRARNRRVEIIVQSTLVKQTLDQRRARQRRRPRRPADAPITCTPAWTPTSAPSTADIAPHLGAELGAGS